MYVKEMVIQSLPLLIICGLGEIIAGSTLSGMTRMLEDIPGLIVVIPAIIALRGNISTAFASRLGSAYHLGIIDSDNMWNEELKQNIIGSLTLSLIMSIIIGTLAYISSIPLGVSPDPIKIVMIVVLAGIISGIILTLMTIIIVFLVFKKGYDPDNITGPALATFGDIITMLCILGAAIFVEVIL
ncbi:MAG: divalent cation transporter [Thermoplasmata archaeon]|nr:MAG: divalent cation transporter [Thermoplasmata archaeon]RLF36108.1 MAG: divalent cation transporter [Thermoplasmata archaeon]